MSDKCKIQWIDPTGKPTPDENEAVGTITSIIEITGEPAMVRPFLICAAHLERAKKEGFFQERVADLPGGRVMKSRFEFLPFKTLLDDP